MFGVFFFLSLYLQNILGYSPVHAGVVFLPMTFLVVVVAPLAGATRHRSGPRWPIVVGMALLGRRPQLCAGSGCMPWFVHMLPGMILGGVGMGSAMGPMTTAALSTVRVERAGVASSVCRRIRHGRSAGRSASPW